ncbi:hypothetical protein CUR178_05363 [Leishmania enriettii]|uniref:Uncharacterized protein n=1 Tax=Leishmania enriettii TaxID=5663 RepID=A0A836H715_LEIEN|nr:hypothetical protein CUR178_05363 [Leishmania enriettii]
MGDVRVSFAFVTSRSLNCCASTHCAEESAIGVSEPRSEALLNHSRDAILKVLDYDTGCARVFRMTHPRGASMRCVYESLADVVAANTGEVICYTPPPMSAGGVLSLCAMKVLEPADEVPDVLFCQKAAVPRRSAVSLSRWLLINVLMSGSDGVLTVGHVPCAVPVAVSFITRDGVFSSMCALLKMGLECERQLRDCALFCCTAEEKSLVLRDPFFDGACPSQVAIIYGVVDVGEVVLVSAPLLPSVSKASSSVLQAVVVRRYAEDGVTLYDVEEVDTTLVLERLTCTQLVPL